MHRLFPTSIHHRFSSPDPSMLSCLNTHPALLSLHLNFLIHFPLIFFSHPISLHFHLSISPWICIPIPRNSPIISLLESSIPLTSHLHSFSIYFSSNPADSGSASILIPLQIRPHSPDKIYSIARHKSAIEARLKRKSWAYRAQPTKYIMTSLY